MKQIPLEDSFGDVIGKAQVGLKLSNTDLAGKAGIDVDHLVAAKNGEADDEILEKIAPALNLHAGALIDLAHERHYPETPDFADGFAMFSTPYNENISVNNYLVWDPVVREAAVFDTGNNAEEILNFIRQKQLVVRAVFITHTHPDHIAALDEILAATGAQLYVSDREPLERPGVKQFDEDDAFPIGYLSVRTLNTWGHSPGQTTFVVSGLSQPLAIVGDSIFACSMGRSLYFFKEQLTNNSGKILTLPEDTILAPGHGPLTTVAFEKAHNPFYAE